MNDVPEHYARTIRALIRFAILGIATGMILGIVWTEFRKTMRYSAHDGAPRKITDDVRKELIDAGHSVRRRQSLELPAGFMAETALHLKFSHGHVIMVAGVLPLCFALLIHFAYLYGNRPLTPGLLKAFYWMYMPGAIGALLLMVYKGMAQLVGVRAGVFDLAMVDHTLFGGSVALRAVLYGTIHTVMSAGAFTLFWGLWKAFKNVPAAPVPPAEADRDALPYV